MGLIVPNNAAGQSGEVDLTRGQIVGVVVDASTEGGLGGAYIRLVGSTLEGPVGDDGRFLLPRLQPGVYVLVTEQPGYRARSDTVQVEAGVVVQLRVPMTSTPIQLDPIEVRVQSKVLLRRGFYERQQQGYAGAFISREDVEERAPRDVSELLDGLSGVRVLQNGIEGARVVFQRAIDVNNSGVCRPALFLDGVKSQIQLFDLILDPEHLEGVEVYVGAGVPGRYNDPCGAILIWTRIP